MLDENKELKDCNKKKIKYYIPDYIPGDVIGIVCFIAIIVICIFG